MPRANRHFLPRHVSHLTRRCHQKAFQLKFARDRRRYLHWVFEAKRRFGLSVLNFMVTSNHIHLLVRDTGVRMIPQSMQSIAGPTAQEYNQRKGRQGAFWKAIELKIQGHILDSGRLFEHERQERGFLHGLGVESGF